MSASMTSSRTGILGNSRHRLTARRKGRRSTEFKRPLQNPVTSATQLEMLGHALTHTPSTAFRHLPPNSARFSYATEGALFISAQLSSDAVSALRKVPVLI